MLINALTLTSLVVLGPSMAKAYSHRAEITKPSCIPDMTTYERVFKAYCSVYKSEDLNYQFKSAYFHVPQNETEKASAYCSYTYLPTNTTQLFTEGIAKDLGGGKA
ncbi:hypothetical protein I302_103195 [Kwoniella bestiolae CBS 10118]|uniref:Uncharacterized protein n=1 Tax=Kwoniella bestiolae CBS 10118 TaxID=1296100 RepID=A0A1B9G7R1_9TREE|nr:hypothetical protein I302_01893 [Kwoniella bestiolae CBS 10118]OCF27058.1 hypothetical protein I302_01893 [Kwoniella bestiolae CBS 10118]